MKKQYCGTRDKEKRAAAMMQQLLFMANHANNDTKCTPGFKAGCVFGGWGAARQTEISYSIIEQKKSNLLLILLASPI